MAIITKTIDMLDLPLKEGVNQVCVTALDTEPNDPLIESTKSTVAEINSGGFVFALGSDGKYVVLSRGDVASNIIEIPEKYNGIDVNRIGAGAFKGTDITSVKIPHTITHISKEAFESCSVLRTVTIAENSQLQFIGEEAFHLCAFLHEITIPKTVTTIEKRAFHTCHLTNISFESFVGGYDPGIDIGVEAFANTGLTSVDLGPRRVFVGDSAFAENKYLEYIEFGDCAVTIGDNVCANCPKLTTARLYDTHMVGDKAKYTDLTYLGAGAFRDCPSFYDLGIIPKTVSWIGKEAFANTKLEGGIPQLECTLHDTYAWFCTTENAPTNGTFYELTEYNESSEAMGQRLWTLTSGMNLYKLDRMPAPQIRKEGTNLVITDTSGIADEFKIFVGTEHVANLKVDGTLEII